MALILSFILLTVFTISLYLGKIGEASYCVLISISVLLGLALHGFDRIRGIDFKNLKLDLDEIKETKKELLVRQEQLKSIVLPLAHILAYLSVAEGRMMSRESHAIKRRWMKNKLSTLVNAIPLKPEEMESTNKISKIYQEIDDILITKDGSYIASHPDFPELSAKLDSLSEELDNFLQQDCHD
ncbi:hypothetical protein [Geothrix oryzae]|uniref:hypothetical protein n=1 Tax=Geothrix oryzae TaxID=2927975 RepID=UPI0025739E89|nr:hypothetical protein [Geothrix oryzae]